MRTLPRHETSEVWSLKLEAWDFRGPRRSLYSQRRQRGGHTLIELVGVVLVLVILASVLVPVVLRRVDRAAWTKEVNDLGAISNAIALQIIRNAAVPNQANWAATTADWIMR